MGNKYIKPFRAVRLSLPAKVTPESEPKQFLLWDLQDENPKAEHRTKGLIHPSNVVSLGADAIVTFADLHNRSAREIEKFAQRRGMLNLCEHELPFGHTDIVIDGQAVRGCRYEFLGPKYDTLLQDWDDDNGPEMKGGIRESLESWKALSKQAYAMIQLSQLMKGHEIKKLMPHEQDLWEDALWLERQQVRWRHSRNWWCDEFSTFDLKETTKRWLDLKRSPFVNWKKVAKETGDPQAEEKYYARLPQPTFDEQREFGAIVLHGALDEWKHCGGVGTHPAPESGLALSVYGPSDEHGSNLFGALGKQLEGAMLDLEGYSLEHCAGCGEQFKCRLNIANTESKRKICGNCKRKDVPKRIARAKYDRRDDRVGRKYPERKKSTPKAALIS